MSRACCVSSVMIVTYYKYKYVVTTLHVCFFKKKRDFDDIYVYLAWKAIPCMPYTDTKYTSTSKSQFDCSVHSFEKFCVDWLTVITS